MQMGSIEKRTAFTRYMEPVSQRPALLRANALDDALLTR